MYVPGTVHLGLGEEQQIANSFIQQFLTIKWVYLASEKPVTSLRGKSVAHRSSCPSEGLTNFTHVLQHRVLTDENEILWQVIKQYYLSLHCVCSLLYNFFNPLMFTQQPSFHPSQVRGFPCSCHNQLDEISLPSLLSSLLCHRLQIKIEKICIGLSSSRA